MLIKDIVVVDAPGDTLSPEQCLAYNYDGVIAGYNPGEFWRTADTNKPSQLFDNLNEIRICRRPLEDYLQLIKSTTITKREVEKSIYRYLDDGIQYMTKNPIITNIQLCIPDNLNCWLGVTNGTGLLFLYHYLMSQKAPLDVRFSLFGDVNVYVCDNHDNPTPYAVIVLAKIPNNSMIAKVWVINEHTYRDVWGFIEFIVKQYKGIKSGSVNFGQDPKDYEDSKLVLLDGLTDKLRSLGYPVDKYT